MLRSLLIAALAAATLGCSTESPSAPRPDVVVVLIDTLRADRLPFYGYPVDTAPFLSELAEDSVVFEKAWSTTSWTAPATASLFTGVYPNQHGVRTGVWVHQQFDLAEHGMRLDRIPASIDSLPAVMKSLGYRTFGITDNRNISDAQGFKRGFDRFANFDYEGGPTINQTLASWVEEIQGSDPSFVYLHYMDPHEPYNQRDPWFTDPQSEDEIAQAHARYLSEIGYVDQHVREAFEMLGVDDDTVVIVLSDHGEEFGEHGGMSHRFKLYNELTLVPLMIRHPGVSPVRKRVARSVSIIDVLPTLRDILGAPPAEQDEGIPLTRYYLDEEQPAPRHLFAMRTWTRPDKKRLKHAVMFRDSKFIHTMPANAAEFYDLGSDPWEQTNLVQERHGQATSLYQKWVDFGEVARVWEQETVEVEVSEEDLKAIEALGYTGK